MDTYTLTGGQDSYTRTFEYNGDDLVDEDTTSQNTVTWDGNGRQTSQLADVPDNYKLEYDWDGNLILGQNGSANDKMTAIYTPDGVRIAKERIWSDSSDYNHKYIVDTVGEVPVILLVLDADDSDKPIVSFVHAEGQVIMQYDGAMTDTNAERYFYLHDRLGSVRQVIDEDANIENGYTYIRK